MFVLQCILSQEANAENAPPHVWNVIQPRTVPNVTVAQLSIHQQDHVHQLVLNRPIIIKF